jgi:hypothetical protein
MRERWLDEVVGYLADASIRGRPGGPEDMESARYPATSASC